MFVWHWGLLDYLQIYLAPTQGMCLLVVAMFGSGWGGG